MLTAAAQGFGTALALIVAIGAQNAFVLRQGIRREHVVLVVAVCAAADAVLVTVGVAGVGAAIVAHPRALALARYGGAAFLLGFAVMAFMRARHPDRLEPSALAPASRTSVLAACLGFTFLNPHVYLDTVVLLGALAGTHAGGGRWAFGVGAVVASIVWFCTLGFGAARLGPLFARRRAWQVLDGAIGVVMTVLAVALVV